MTTIRRLPIRYRSYGILRFSYYAVEAAVSPLVPLAAVGIGTGPPGESGNLAVRISTPSSVTSRVCSRKNVSRSNQVAVLDLPNCAVRVPSCVTLVQSSGHVLSL